MTEFVTMPALGESVTEGTLTVWLKKTGESVDLDEPILEVSTDKVDTEVPSPAAGILAEILVETGETVAVGTKLARIESADDDGEVTNLDSAGKPAAAAVAAASSDATSAPVSSISSAPENNSNQEVNSARTYVTPIVRQLAKEKNVDLSSIKGTGVGGRIRRQDVLAAASALPTAENSPTSASLPISTSALNSTQSGSIRAQIEKKAVAAASLRGTKQKLSGIRKAIARHMVDSLGVSAQLTTVMEVDVTRLVQLRAKAKDNFYTRENVKLTYLPFFIKAATEALKAHPIINSSLVGEEIIYHDREHIGVAVDTEKGLYVPVIKNAGDFSIAGISKAVADLATRTRAGKITPDELTGSTFTVTNTGSIGALMDTPIINQPNVAILGTGVIHRAPGVVKDQDGNETISIRSKCYLCLSYDHRLIDGADASRYLRDVKLRLEEADFAAELGI